MIAMLLEHLSLAVQQPDVVAAALGRFSRSRSVSFTDCLILEIARSSGHRPLGTFDRSLAKLDDVEGL